eukprot:Partr_v1_DN28280_c0_g1_i12_m75497
MKFSCCANGYVPDWMMDALYSLSVLDISTFKSVVSACKSAFVDPGDHNLESIQKIPFSESVDARSLAICLQYLVENAASFRSSADLLFHELQQLGLPKDHSSHLSGVYAEVRDDMIARFKRSYLKTGHDIERVDIEPLDTANGSLFYRVSITTNAADPIIFFANKHQLQCLLAELDVAAAAMRRLAE